VAIVKLVFAIPAGVNFVSASLPRRPSRITLLTLRVAMVFTCTLAQRSLSGVACDFLDRDPEK
jgi:hypothetical protein